MHHGDKPSSEQQPHVQMSILKPLLQPILYISVIMRARNPFISYFVHLSLSSVTTSQGYIYIYILYKYNFFYIYLQIYYSSVDKMLPFLLYDAMFL